METKTAPSGVVPWALLFILSFFFLSPSPSRDMKWQSACSPPRQNHVAAAAVAVSSSCCEKPPSPTRAHGVGC